MNLLDREVPKTQLLDEPPASERIFLLFALGLESEEVSSEKMKFKGGNDILLIKIAHARARAQFIIKGRVGNLRQTACCRC
jgi:hypothetical protein